MWSGFFGHQRERTLRGGASRGMLERPSRMESGMGILGIRALILTLFFTHLVTASGAQQLFGSSWSAYSCNEFIQNDSGNITSRQIVRVANVICPDRSSPCGLAARKELELLKRNHRIYVEILTGLTVTREHRARLVSGPSLKLHMVSKGFAKPVANENDEQIVQAAAEAEKAKRGCVWYWHNADEDTTVVDDYGEVSTPTQNVRVRLDGASTAAREIRSSSFPTGFEMTRYVIDDQVRPVDFLWLPDGTMLVAWNEGLVFSVRPNGNLRPTPYLNVKDITNDYHDHGLMSIAIPPDYATDPYLYFFLVFEHDTDPDSYTLPRTSRVMKVKPDATGWVEDVSTRQTILGTRNGFGCDDCEVNNPDCDCIPAEGKSHVGGGLAFTSNKELYVACGDGGIAWVVPEALRSQRFDTFAGKILKVDENGRGFADNPFVQSHTNGDLNSRNAKIYAMGIRNVLHVHVSPVNSDNLYIGDTMWHTEEDVTVVRRGSNCGWPCFESFQAVPQYRNDLECLKFANLWTHNEPIVSWEHETTASSMIGERASFSSFPARYRDVLIYGDMASRFIGFAKLDNDDRLVEDLERIYLFDAPVQMREGPDGCLYFISVRNRGQLRRVCYTPDPTPVKFDRMNPVFGSSVSANGLKVVGTFTKSLEPSSVTNETILLRTTTGTSIPTVVEYEYDTRTFTMTPTTQVPAGASFRIIGVDGEDGLLDLDHNVAPRRIYSRFSTLGGGDDVRPEVASILPADNSEGHYPEDDITIRFTETMDIESVRENVQIEPAILNGNGDIVSAGGPIVIVATAYIAASNTFRFSAVLEFSSRYMVTVKGGTGHGMDTSGNYLAEDFVYSFATGSNPDKIAITIEHPEEGSTFAVDEEVFFRASAVDQAGNLVPAASFNWQVIIHHCTYEIPRTCHTHGEYIITDTTEGTFKTPNHYDRFFYEIYLIVNHDGETGEASRFLETKTVPFTLTSDPPGVHLSLSGYSKPTPFTEDVVIGSLSQISAPQYAGEDNYLEFQSWSEGGMRTKELLVSDTAQTFHAVFTERVAEPPTPTPTPELVSGSESVSWNPPLTASDTIPLSGSFEIHLDHTTLLPRDIVVVLKRADDNSNVDENIFQIPAGTQTNRAYTFLLSVVLDENVLYKLSMDLRARNGDWRTRIVRAPAAFATSAADDDSSVDDVYLLSPPEHVPVTGTISLNYAYEATQVRDLVALIRAKRPGGLVAYSSATVSSAGQGTITLSYDTALETGETYQISIQLREAGGDYTTWVARKFYDTVCQPNTPSVDAILDFPRPSEPFPITSTITLPITVTTAAEGRVIAILLHDDDLLWLGNGLRTVEAIDVPTTFQIVVNMKRWRRVSTGEQIRVRAEIRDPATNEIFATEDRFVWT